MFGTSKRRIRVAILASSALLTGACFTPGTDPGAWNSVPKEVAEHPATPYRLGDIQVTASGVRFRTQSERDILESTIRNALRSAKIFDPSGEQVAKLHANVVDFDQPAASMGAFRSNMEVAYKLVGPGGQVLFEETVRAGGSDDTGSSLGWTRATRARTKAVANNVYELRMALEPALLAHSRRDHPAFLASFGTRATPPPVLVATQPEPRAQRSAEFEEVLVPIQVSADEARDLTPGAYHALVIGNNDYADGDIPDLRTAVNDAEAVSKLLSEEYGFEVNTLSDAGRGEILKSLANIRRSVGENDSLLIYYAGHGYFDEGTRRGYWLPTDADDEEPSNWISTADISDMLRAIPARHVMVVADSCYSGALTRGIKIRNRDQGYLQKMARKRARVVLTSGGLEPVEDGSGSHSVFAQAFLDALENNDNIIEGVGIFSSLRRPVMLNSQQEPEFGDIRNTGHQDGGDFIFVRKR